MFFCCLRRCYSVTSLNSPLVLSSLTNRTVPSLHHSPAISKNSILASLASTSPTKSEARTRPKKKSIIRASMLAFVEVIGSGSYDCSSSVQLFFDDGRYIFECGDGTQRLCTEYGMKLSKLRGIYLSTMTAPSVGGLFGLLLTVADIGKEKVSIVAPTGLKQLFYSSRSFYYRPSFVNTLEEIDLNMPSTSLPFTVTDDDNLKIQAVPVNSRRDMEIQTSFGMHCDAVSYICRLHDLPGKFNPQKALDLGVKKGKLFGLLQRGISITLDDGTEVKSEQVMSPSTPGPIVFIVACPSTEHIESLTSSSEMQPGKFGLDKLSPSDGSEKTDIGTMPSRTCVMCHLGPRDVLSHPTYRKWCDSFGDTTTHIPLHSTMSRRQTIYASHAEDMALLHFTLDKEIFPLPHDCLLPPSPSTVEEAREDVDEKTSLGLSLSTELVKILGDDNWELFKNWTGEWVGAESKLKFNLAPLASIGIDRSGVRSRYIERKPDQPLQQWREATPPYASEPEPAGTEMPTPACISRMSPGTTTVRFLGTGAALPGKRRNVSSTMLDLHARGSVLLDCGEGTWGQLVRLFGRDDAQRAVANIRVIFISHMHADHHLGLMSLLHQRSHAMAERPELRHGPQLIIIGPCHLNTWLEGFQQAARVPLRDRLKTERRSYRFCDAKTLTDPQTADSKFFADAFGLEFGCVNVIHCPLSYGLVVRDCVQGWKVVFSGDTRPCPALVEVGKDATLVIHEATLEDELSQEALDKSHSTTSEALTICADKMLAWRTILTHFSQRYPKIPRLDDRIVKKMYDGRAAIACDLMSVDFTRLEEIPRIIPAIRDCFPDEGEQWVTTPVTNLPVQQNKSEE